MFIIYPGNGLGIFHICVWLDTQLGRYSSKNNWIIWHRSLKEAVYACWQIGMAIPLTLSTTLTAHSCYLTPRRSKSRTYLISLGHEHPALWFRSALSHWYNEGLRITTIMSPLYRVWISMRLPHVRVSSGILNPSVTALSSVEKT